MQLVIAEKPSAAMSIAAVTSADERKDGYTEGADYLVSWYVGHLEELVDAAITGLQRNMTDFLNSYIAIEKEIEN